MLVGAALCVQLCQSAFCYSSTRAYYYQAFSRSNNVRVFQLYNGLFFALGYGGNFSTLYTGMPMLRIMQLTS